MQSISIPINQEIRKFVEKVCEEFPEGSCSKMLLIWCKLQEICGFLHSEEEEKTVKDCSNHETNTSLMQSISILISQEIRKFAEKVHEEFPQIQIHEMLSIWCELHHTLHLYNYIHLHLQYNNTTTNLLQLYYSKFVCAYNYGPWQS